MDRLIAIVRNYAGDERDWDLQLDVSTDHIAPVALGSPNKLGWTTWLGPLSAGSGVRSDIVIDDPQNAQAIAKAREQMHPQAASDIAQILKTHELVRNANLAETRG